MSKKTTKKKHKNNFVAIFTIALFIISMIYFVPESPLSDLSEELQINEQTNNNAIPINNQDVSTWKQSVVDYNTWYEGETVTVDYDLPPTFPDMSTWNIWATSGNGIIFTSGSFIDIFADDSNWLRYDSEYNDMMSCYFEFYIDTPISDSSFYYTIGIKKIKSATEWVEYSSNVIFEDTGAVTFVRIDVRSQWIIGTQYDQTLKIEYTDRDGVIQTALDVYDDTFSDGVSGYKTGVYFDLLKIVPATVTEHIRTHHRYASATTKIHKVEPSVYYSSTTLTIYKLEHWNYESVTPTVEVISGTNVVCDGVAIGMYIFLFNSFVDNKLPLKDVTDYYLIDKGFETNSYTNDWTNIAFEDCTIATNITYSGYHSLLTTQSTGTYGSIYMTLPNGIMYLTLSVYIESISGGLSDVYISTYNGSWNNHYFDETKTEKWQTLTAIVNITDSDSNGNFAFITSCTTSKIYIDYSSLVFVHSAEVTTVNSSTQKVIVDYINLDGYKNPNTEFLYITIELYDIGNEELIANTTMHTDEFGRAEWLLELIFEEVEYAIYSYAEDTQIPPQFSMKFNVEIEQTETGIKYLIIPINPPIRLEDTTNFIPNAVGSSTQLTAYGTGSNNYDRMDDPIGSPDDDTTYVARNTAGTGIDYYNIPDHTTESGTINSVTVYVRVKKVSSDGDCGIRIYTHSTGYLHDLTINYAWNNYNHAWTINPNTASAWTWAEIDALQIGLALTNIGGAPRATQVYAVVDYTQDLDDPVISAPANQGIELGSNTDSISWTITDANPNDYIIYDGATPVQSGSYSSGTPIVFELDDVADVLGGHTMRMWADDDYSNDANDYATVTVSDTTDPILNAPSDFGYELGSTSNDIIWVATDLDADTWEVKLDTVYYDSGSWTSGVNIVVDVDGLDVDVYSFVITVEDGSGNTDVDTVIVTVEDTTNPQTTSPSDQEFEYGETGYTVSWTGTDLSPNNYVIKRNGSTVDSGDWTDGVPVVYNFNSETSGIWNFTIIFYDDYGNWVSDEVIIIIHSTEAPRISDITTDPVYPDNTETVTIECTVTDVAGVDTVLLYYKYSYESTWTCVEMTGGSFIVTIGSFNAFATIQYYIWANDTLGNSDYTSTYSFDVETENGLVYYFTPQTISEEPTLYILDTSFYLSSVDNDYSYDVYLDGNYLGVYTDLQTILKNNTVGDHNLTYVLFSDSVERAYLSSTYEYLYTVETSALTILVWNKDLDLAAGLIFVNVLTSWANQSIRVSDNTTWLGNYQDEGTSIWTFTVDYGFHNITIGLFNGTTLIFEEVFSFTIVEPAQPEGLIIYVWNKDLDLAAGLISVNILTSWGNQSIRVSDNVTWLGNYAIEGTSIWTFTVDYGFHNISIYLYNGVEEMFVECFSFTIQEPTITVWTVHFDIITTTGVGLPFETCKIIVNDSRIYSNEKYYLDGVYLEIQAFDFYDNLLYETTRTITNHVDISLVVPFNLQTFENPYEVFVRMTLYDSHRDGSANQTWDVSPHSSLTLFMMSSSYNILVTPLDTEVNNGTHIIYYTATLQEYVDLAYKENVYTIKVDTWAEELEGQEEILEKQLKQAQLVVLWETVFLAMMLAVISMLIKWGAIKCINFVLIPFMRILRILFGLQPKILVRDAGGLRFISLDQWEKYQTQQEKGVV